MNNNLKYVTYTYVNYFNYITVLFVIILLFDIRYIRMLLMLKLYVSKRSEFIEIYINRVGIMFLLFHANNQRLDSLM